MLPNNEKSRLFGEEKRIKDDTLSLQFSGHILTRKTTYETIANKARLRSRGLSETDTTTNLDRTSCEQRNISPRVVVTQCCKPAAVICLLLITIGYIFLSTPNVQEMLFGGSIEPLENHLVNLSSRPNMGYTQLSTLHNDIIPSKSGSARNRKLVIVGDVHGCVEELEALLHKLDPEGHDKKTHIVLAGDLVTKGPQSLKVLDLAIKIKASCVRGNHDDELMLTYHALQRQAAANSKTDTEEDTFVEHFDENLYSHVGNSSKTGAKVYTKHSKEAQALARNMKKRHAAYLDSCPLILKADIPGMGDVNIVHAGIVPGIGLMVQDPIHLMNMRTIDKQTHLPSDSHDGMHWTKYWNNYQRKRVSHRKPPTTVIYGHDAKRGLDIKKYSIGLDSNCVRGNRLSALVIEGGKNPKQYIVSMQCQKYV